MTTTTTSTTATSNDNDDGMIRTVVHTSNNDDGSASSSLSSIRIHRYGATVLSYNAQGREQLFVSKDAILDGTKPIRGGIPLVFPIFGPQLM